MEEVNEVQALEKISNEVDESQIKVILSSQCIKAQNFLLNNLKKQSRRHKEICSLISSANLKEENEIKNAEQEIRSMLIAQETIKSANVEIRKELLLAKYRKSDIIERITEGKNKYDTLWLNCKTRFESIPFVQKLLQATERQKSTENAIIEMDEQITKLYDDMETRRKICADLDKRRCIELAGFIVKDMPNAINLIRERNKQIRDLTNEIEQLLQQEKIPEAMVTAESIVPSNAINIMDNKSTDVDHISKADKDPLIPKLNLINYDLDIMDVGLDQVKMKKDKLFNCAPTRTSYTIHNLEKDVENHPKDDKSYEFIISPYFNPYDERKQRNFSERKLINILEDISVNNSEIINIVKKVNPEQLKPVNEISVSENTEMTQKRSRDKEGKPIVSKEIEEVDLTSSYHVENIIIPPSQFMDITFTDDTPKKKVCFDLSSSMKISEIIDVDKEDCEELSESANQTLNSQLDASATSDESLKKIKDMMLKKHNLDLSPQFVYAKTNVLPKKVDDKIVTSKFFQGANSEVKIIENNDNEMEFEVEPRSEEPLGGEAPSKKESNQNVLEMNVEDLNVPSPKSNQICLKTFEEQKPKTPVSGLLFTHGAQAIPDSLNVSLSTTGYEESDFPHCIDSNILLSPKADLCDNTNNGHNQEPLSQEVPNFLSGFRKAGLCFFGGPSSSKSNPNSSELNEDNNFRFNFGGEKKSRGGLFSLFQ